MFGRFAKFVFLTFALFTMSLSGYSEWRGYEEDGMYMDEEDQELVVKPLPKGYHPVSDEWHDTTKGPPLCKFVIPAGIAAIGLTIGAVKALECENCVYKTALQFTGSFQASTGGDTTLVFKILFPDTIVFYNDSLISGDATGGAAVNFSSGTTTSYKSGDTFTVSVISLSSTGSSSPTNFTVNGLIAGVIFDTQSATPPTGTTTFTFTIP
ncbi:MAG: hypothetical protein K940chlam3_00022 [Chlamydiae bacterium]|nr:hypothetical protein [Chlamydiota bacterium]